MQHVVLVAPYFSDNMRHCVRCFAELRDCRLGVLSQEPADRLPAELRSRLAAVEQLRRDRLARAARLAALVDE